MILRIMLFTFVTMFVFWIPPVKAYIDPASGSAIMSAIVGLFVATGMFIKTYWYKLKSIFSDAKKVDSNISKPHADQTEEPKD